MTFLQFLFYLTQQFNSFITPSGRNMFHRQCPTAASNVETLLASQAVEGSENTAALYFDMLPIVSDGLHGDA
jgi:hypothetical protein